MQLTRLQIPLRCLHPSYVYNKHTGKMEVYPCGHCEACLLDKSDIQQRRIDAEVKQHRYSVMFTLTYDNHMLPRAERFIDKFGVPQVRLIGRASSLFKSTPLNRKVKNKYLLNFDDKLPRIENECFSNQFGVVCKKDIQNFLKRLRHLIEKDTFTKGCPIRYYICSEYGPDTLRPHYHGILFFDSANLATKIVSFIVNAWSLRVRLKGKGRNQFKRVPFAAPYLTRNYVKFCDANTSYYVASYITSACELPSVLRFHEFLPFRLSSKGPIIGLFKVDKASVFERIERNDITDYKQYITKDGCLQTSIVQFAPALCASIFRKCFRFNKLSFDSKFERYSYFEKHVEDYLLYNRSLNGFRSYLRDNDTYNYFRLDMDNDSTYYASRLCYFVTRLFNLRKYFPFCDSVHAYLMFFDKYLYLVSQFRLSRFYSIQDDFINSFGLQHITLFYPHVLYDSDYSNKVSHPTIFSHARRFLKFHKLEPIISPLFFQHVENVSKKKFDRVKTKKFNNALINGHRILQ